MNSTIEIFISRTVSNQFVCRTYKGKPVVDLQSQIGELRLYLKANVVGQEICCLLPHLAKREGHKLRNHAFFQLCPREPPTHVILQSFGCTPTRHTDTHLILYSVGPTQSCNYVIILKLPP